LRQGPAAGKLISKGSVRASVAAADQRGLDPIQEAIRLFNDRFFFEAHEVLEEVWRQEHGESRVFLQGLIQICAAYHHTQKSESTPGGRHAIRRVPGARPPRAPHRSEEHTS